MILIMRHTVQDYDAWKLVFDAGEPLRAKYGASGHVLYRGYDDANDLTIQLRFPSRESAEAFLADPELAVNMQHAGVETQPVLTRVREAEVLEYAVGCAA
jgi:hypothetical protein